MHPNLSFRGQTNGFSGEVPSPLHHTPTPLDANVGSSPPYWNPKYATGMKHQHNQPASIYLCNRTWSHTCKVNVHLYKQPLMHQCSHTSALISVKLVLSQTPANTAKPWTQASAARGVPAYSPMFCKYSLCLPMEGWCRLSWRGYLALCRGGLPIYRGTNQACCKVTTLIETNAFPVSQTDTWYQLFVFPLSRQITHQSSGERSLCTAKQHARLAVEWVAPFCNEIWGVTYEKFFLEITC